MNKYTANSKKADNDQQNAIFPFYVSRKQMHENFHEAKTIQIGTIRYGTTQIRPFCSYVCMFHD